MRIDSYKHDALTALCWLFALSIVAVASPASAQITIKAKSEFGLGGTTQPTQNSSIAGASPSQGVDLLPIQSDSLGNSIFGHVYSYTDGAFGSRSSGSNMFSIVGTATYQNSFTATTAGDYQFAYQISAGDLNTFLSGGANGTQRAALSAVIKETVDGSPAMTLLDYESTMGLASATSVATFSESGLLLNASGPSLTVGSGSYNWADYGSYVDLGALLSGQQVTIDYTLVSTAVGTSTVTTALETGFCGNNNIFALASLVGRGGDCGTNDSTAGSAEARVGDPVQTNSPAGPLVFGVSVPEPASMTLLGDGLAALAFSRRRHG